MSGRSSTLPILWVAFLASQLLFQGTLLIVDRPAALEDPAILALVPVALAQGLFGLVGVPMFLKHMSAESAFIVRMALFEGMVLMGFTLAFLGASLAVPLGLFAVSVVLNALTFPSEERFTAWEVRRLGEE